MSGYVHFTDEQKDRARQTDIVSLLERQGEKVRRAGSEYEWLDGTAKVSIRGNLWFHQYEREGGNAMGDDWKHMIEVEDTVEFTSKKPIVLESIGECPKENSR